MYKKKRQYAPASGPTAETLSFRSLARGTAKDEVHEVSILAHHFHDIGRRDY